MPTATLGLHSGVRGSNGISWGRARAYRVQFAGSMRTLGWLLVASVVAACEGTIDAPTRRAAAPGGAIPGSPDDEAAVDEGHGFVSSCDDEAPVDPAGPHNFVNVHRLNAVEYRNTFRDLFGVDLNPTAAFPRETRSPFTNTAVALTVDPDLGAELFHQPLRVLDQVFSSSARARVVTCEPAQAANPTPSGGLNPFNTVTALSYSSMAGVMAASGSVGYFNPGDFIRYDDLNFGSVGPTQMRLEVSVDAAYAGGRFEVREGCTSATDGTVIGGLDMSSTGGWDVFTTRTIQVTPLTGMRTICIVAARGPQDGIGNVKTFSFVGTQVVSTPASPSPTQLDHRGCAEKVIREFGAKAFRRPLLAAEVTQLLGLYDATRASYPANAPGLGPLFDESLKAPLHALLVSPHFTYRIIDVPAGTARKALSPFELAQRLSYFLWGTMPDEALIAVAANGTLLQRGVLLQQVERMLKDERALHLVDAFAVQWFGADKFATKQKSATEFPEYTPALRAAMLTETRLLFEEMIRSDLSLHHLLTARSTFLNAELARFYGVTGVPQDGSFVKVDMSSTARRGLLGHASVHASTSDELNSSIVKRGLLVIEQITCEGVGSPPADVPPLPDEMGQARTNPRQLLEQHVRNPACAGCHTRIDPPGFVLETFDAIGRYRTRYPNGDLVDTSSALSSGEPVRTISDLVEAISRGQRYNVCASRKLMTFALGRFLKPGDACAAERLGLGSARATDRFSDLVKQIVTSDQFLNQGRGEDR